VIAAAAVGVGAALVLGPIVSMPIVVARGPVHPANGDISDRTIHVGVQVAIGVVAFFVARAYL